MYFDMQELRRFLAPSRWSARGILFGATLAWSEPLTTLPRSARSRVSSSRSLWKAPTRTPVASLSEILTARASSPVRVGSRQYRHRRAELRSARFRACGRVRAQLRAALRAAAVPDLVGRRVRGPRSAFQSEREEETRDRGERGSAVRGSDQASVARRGPLTRLTGDGS